MTRHRNYPHVTVLETVIRRAPLGIRFVDLVLGVAVTDGLLVRGWPVDSAVAPHIAERSPLSGVYGFRALPGFAAYESGERPASDWHAGYGSPPDGEAANFIVAVEDRKERFLPQTLLLRLPKESLLEMSLFSLPSRTAPPGFGTVRGELRLDEKQPASWAKVTATIGTRTYVTVADARGMFALFVPYASMLAPLVGSPPHGTVRLDQMSWPLSIQVFYQPPPASQQPVQTAPVPGLGFILNRQPAATLYDTPSVPAAAVARDLPFGSDLILKTHGKSYLMLNPVP